MTVRGYLEGYIGIDGYRPPGQDRPIFFNFGRDREFSVNLAYIELTGQYDRFRLKFVPAVGSYMQANYAPEPEGFRYILEGYAGLQVSERYDIWLDAGVLPSPFGYESPVSLGQNTLTRSLSAENIPYYLAGARLSVPLGRLGQVNLFIVNGWQNIRETNLAKSFVGQYQLQLTKRLLFNYSTYLGDERRSTDTVPGRAYRSVHDLFLNYRAGNRVNIIALYNLGTQNGIGPSTRFWQTAHVTARYQWLERLSVSTRAEVFTDPHQVVLSLERDRATLYGGSLGLNYGLTDRALLRLESRYLQSDLPVFSKRAGESRRGYMFNTIGLTVGM